MYTHTSHITHTSQYTHYNVCTVNREGCGLKKDVVTKVGKGREENVGVVWAHGVNE